MTTKEEIKVVEELSRSYLAMSRGTVDESPTVESLRKVIYG